MFDDTPKRGLRIDHILLSKNLEHAMVNTGIDYSARAMEKPSDHCPIWLRIKIKFFYKIFFFLLDWKNCLRRSR